MAQRDDNGRSLEQPTRHGTTNLKADKIALLARQLHNITINGVSPTISNNSMRYELDIGAGLSPFLGRIKEETTNTIEIGFNRTLAGYQDFIIMNDSYNALTTIDEIILPAAVGAFYVYYRIKRSRFFSEPNPQDIVVFDLGFTDDNMTLGRQTKRVNPASLPSGTAYQPTLLSSDVTPIWHIPVGIFVNPGQSDATWIQLLNNHITLSIPHSNIFYDENSKSAFANVTPIGLAGIGFDLVQTVPVTGISIPVNATSNIFFYSNDINVVTGDYLLMHFGSTIGASRPTQDKHIFIGNITTDSDGKLINLHDFTNGALPMYKL